MVKHVGLYFTETHIAAARKEHKALDMAWSQLAELQPQDDIEAVLLAGFRYRFDDNCNAGMLAAQTLIPVLLRVGEGDNLLEQCMRLAALAQGYEMLHPLLDDEQRAQWKAAFAARGQALGAGTKYHEQVWRAALNVIAGVVLEDEAQFEAGAEVYRRVVREDIRPDGYIQGAVDGRDGESFLRHIVSTQALVLMAEAAKQVEVDLWGVEQRGVSVVTAAAYPLYYYYYPQKWRWDEGLSIDAAQRIFRTHGGFLEMVYCRRPLRDMGMLLQEWRPVWDARGGGLTTLTHSGVVARKGLFG
jgi:hypothetical protein